MQAMNTKPLKIVFFLFMAMVVVWPVQPSAGLLKNKAIKLEYRQFVLALKKLDSDLTLIQKLLQKDRVLALKCSNGTTNGHDRENISYNFTDILLSIATIRNFSHVNDFFLLNNDHPDRPSEIVLINKTKTGLIHFPLPLLRAGDFGLKTWKVAKSTDEFIEKNNYLLDSSQANQMIGTMDGALEIIIRERSKIRNNLEKAEIFMKNSGNTAQTP